MVAFFESRRRQFRGWHVHGMFRPRLFVCPNVITWDGFIFILYLLGRLVWENTSFSDGAHNLHHTFCLVLGRYEASLWFWCSAQWHDLRLAREILHSRLV